MSNANYVVDDERSRTRAALDRLDHAQRTLLIVNQLAGIPEPAIRQALGIEERGNQQSIPEQPRARLALAAGRSPDAPIVDLLNRLAMDSPALELWAEIAAPLERAWSAQRRATRLVTALVAALLIAIIGALVIWLADIRPGGSASVASEPRAPWPNWPPSAEDIPTPTPNLASFASAATPEPSPASGPIFTDYQYLRLIEQTGAGQSELALYDPDVNTTARFLLAGGPILISPDGAWLVAERALRDKPGLSMLAGGNPATGETWQVELASSRATAISDGRIYLLNLAGNDLLHIQQLDLTTGRQIENWELGSDDFRPSSLRAARLILSANGEQLFLVAEWKAAAAESINRTITSLDTANGQATLIAADRVNSLALPSVTSFSVASARPVFGANTIYSVVQDQRTGQARLQFLDLESGEIEGLLLQIPARVVALESQRGENEVHLVPSNTGKTLYVIQTRERQVAIVDLTNRRLTGVVPMLSRPGEETTFQSNLNRVSYLEALFSPDGTRLIMAANREKNQAVNGYPAESPVWVVNTTTWTVEERWQVSGLPRRMTMDASGERLYVRSARADGTVRLSVIATPTGQIISTWDDIPSPEWADIQRIGSTAQSYHEQYGIRPQTGPEPPRDNSILSVLPGVHVEAGEAIAGAETVVTARFVHPLTGAPASGDRALRFDPQATLAIELSNGPNRAILVPTSVGSGIYEGRVQIDSPGQWNARITVINSDGTTWTVLQNDAIDVSAGLVAGGGAYRFVVRPANPVNRRTITLRIWMVQSDSREMLPEEIEFLDTISDDAWVVLTHTSGERVEGSLMRIDHDSFLSWVRLNKAGEWTAQIVLNLATGERVTTNAGVLQIRDLTEPFERATGGDAASTLSGTRMSNASGR